MEETSAEMRGLARELELAGRKLETVLAIDALRDAMQERDAFLGGLAALLRSHLCADLVIVKPRGGSDSGIGISASFPVPGVSSKGFTAVSRALGETDSADTGASIDLSTLVSGAPPCRHALAVPLRLGKKQVGLVIVARTDAAFSESDRELLRVAATQVDSALEQLRNQEALHQRAHLIQAVYRIDRVRDLQLPFDRMVAEILREIAAAMEAESAALLVRLPGGRTLEVRGVTHRTLTDDAECRQRLVHAAGECLDSGHIRSSSRASGAIRSLICAPLQIGQRAIGAICVVNRSSGRPFERWRRALLHGIVSQVDTAVFEAGERVRLVELLARSVGPSLVQRLISAESADLINCQRRVLSVLYADIRGSTELAESTDIDLLLGFTNDYLEGMTQAILSHDGMVDKFVGDEVMAVFGAPFEQPDHAARAVRTARRMQEVHATIMEKWRGQGVDARPIGIGIATGEMLVGELGGRSRSDYTVLGRAANLGARLCSMAAGGDIYLCEETYRLAGAPVPSEPVANVPLKGIARPVTAYRLIADASRP
jgi:class 3 adenylate cyclase